MCDCCDHPLEHAITQALAVAENVSASMAIQNLRYDYEEWKDDEKYDAEQRRVVVVVNRDEGERQPPPCEDYQPETPPTGPELRC